MSKAAQKKGGKEAVKAAPAAPAATTHDVVAGKLTEQKWFGMMELEDGAEFVGDIVDELLSRVMKQSLSSYLRKNVAKFTVNEARKQIMTVIDWQFFKRDEGEMNCETDPVWIEDEEPEPCQTDTWAQGSVPRVKPEEVHIQAEETNQTPVPEEMPDNDMDENVIEEKTEYDFIVEEPELLESSHSHSVRKERHRVMRPRLSGPGQVRRKVKWRPHRGIVSYESLSSITESMGQLEYRLEKEREAAERRVPTAFKPHPLEALTASLTSYMKAQHGRPPGHREIQYDEVGNITNIMRIPPEKLPNHMAKVRYEVVDPQYERAQAKLAALCHGKVNVKQPKQSSHRPIMTRSAWSQMTNKSDGAKIIKPPPLIENFNLVPGVVVRDGQRVRRGPRLRKRQRTQARDADSYHLIQSMPNLTSLAVSDILNPGTPSIKPLGSTPVVPPIRKT